MSFIGYSYDESNSFLLANNQNTAFGKEIKPHTVKKIEYQDVSRSNLKGVYFFFYNRMFHRCFKIVSGCFTFWRMFHLHYYTCPYTYENYSFDTQYQRIFALFRGKNTNLGSFLAYEGVFISFWFSVVVSLSLLLSRSRAISLIKWGNSKRQKTPKITTIPLIHLRIFIIINFLTMCYNWDWKR